MITLQKLLDLTRGTIEELLAKYGNVGCSIGVMKAEQLHFLNVGHRAIEGRATDPPDQETPYLISSMTKPIIALLFGILVNDEQYGVSFDTPVEDIITALKGKTSLRHANRKLTVGDMLNHETEFPRCTNMWESADGEVPWDTVDPIISLLSHLPPNEKFKRPQDFVHARNYSNEGFALAAAIIEIKTGMRWTQFVREKILDPLEMVHTFAGLTDSDRETFSHLMAKSYTAQVDESLGAISTSSSEPKYDDVLRHVKSDQFQAPKAIEVCCSRAAWADTSGRVTPICGAAGMMSTAADMMKFFVRFLEVYMLPKDDKTGDALRALSEINRGFVTIQAYIENRMKDETCAYAGGWNTTFVPWNPKQSESRWPGADGDNSRRLAKAMSELGKDRTATNKAWGFFQDDDHSDSGVPCKSQSRHLALYHGGNMVGATSFCLLLPAENTAVVVLSNTRGFFLDAANMTGMLLADCLFKKGLSEQDVDARCKTALDMAQYIAASYLMDVVRYEKALSENYESADETSNKYSGACVGTYRLTEHIYAEVSLANDSRLLQFRPYGRGHGYLLRVKKGARQSDPTVTMTWAMPMAGLLPMGVGGNNRLNIEVFEVTFQAKDNGFGEFVWNFAGVADPKDDFTFKRIDAGHAT